VGLWYEHVNESAGMWYKKVNKDARLWYEDVNEGAGLWYKNACWRRRGVVNVRQSVEEDMAIQSKKMLQEKGVVIMRRMSIREMGVFTLQFIQLLCFIKICLILNDSFLECKNWRSFLSLKIF